MSFSETVLLARPRSVTTALVEGGPARPFSGQGKGLADELRLVSTR